jgi:DNA sulfur modification protein DndE
MHFTKLRVSAETTSRLRSLRQRTSLTPNLLCRIAFMLSLEEGPLGTTTNPDDDGMEFNAYSLTGDSHESFIAMLRWVETQASTDANEESPADEDLLTAFRAHIQRGVSILAARVRSPADIARLAIVTPA